ncbi:MAG: hypothetical protein HY775_04160 [Acidobacteria bacterium]|nr:hypothetical protein [Acidobacteriota bacterium]
MSAPCVPYFEGDNFGATWQGVTSKEIRVLIYLDTSICHNRECTPPADTYQEVDKIPREPCPQTYPQTPPNWKDCAHVLMRAARALNNFFNARFQTYGRRVRLFAYWTDSQDAAGRRADAADNLKKIRPFAVLDWAAGRGGLNEEYVNAAAARGMLVFSSQVTTYTNSFYRKNAPLAWGFWPDMEHWAALYSSYVCTKVNPYPTAHTGGPNGVGTMNGNPRKFGLFYTTDPTQPGLKRFRQVVEGQLRKCAMDVDNMPRGTFPESGPAVNRSDTGVDQQQAVAKFKSEGVTTVLYLGGLETKFSQDADALEYYPEILVAGDLNNDVWATARLQNQATWGNAWTVSYQMRQDRPEERPGYQAAVEGDPGLDDAGRTWAADFYRDFFMLFQGIQVAGPRLTPKAMSQGFHAIPPKDSTNPFVAACFYDTGDYTCVKDAAETWWDVDGRRPASNDPGCWRQVRGGRRSIAWHWPGRDDVFGNPSDPCNGYGGAAIIDPA